MSENAGSDAPSYRLGDDVEDYCSRCRGISTHAVAGILDGVLVKVLCRSCLTEHRFHHGKGGKSREKERKKLIDEVMKSSPFYKPDGTA